MGHGLTGMGWAAFGDGLEPGRVAVQDCRKKDRRGPDCIDDFFDC